MKYLKLFIPIPIAVLLIIITENYFFEYYLIAAIIIKGCSIIYYLRLDNSGTILINTLTIILVIMMLGEYLFNSYPIIGQISLIISSIAFGLIYFFRQKLKESKDKLTKLKTVAVFVFALSNIASIDRSAGLFPLAIGTLFLTSVYFYDRLTATSNSKKIGV